MMPSLNIFGILFPIFLTIAVGYGYGKFREMNIKPIADLVLYITVPALVISSILRNPLNLTDFIEIGGAAFTVVLGVGILTLLSARLLKMKPSPGLLMGSMFINSGILAFPIVLSAFGREALAKAVLYDAFNGMLIFSLGIFILVGRENAMQIFKLPVLYSIAFAAIVSASKIALPNILINTLAFIGDSTIPVMLLVLGYQLNHIRSNIMGPSLLSAALRLLGGLALSLVFVRLFRLSGLAASVIIISSSMPTAVNSLLLAEEYNIDPDLAASAVVITTLASFLTLPLILHYII